jgi:hypothetical protein
MEGGCMNEDVVKKIYDDVSESYDKTFSGGIWILYDAITWKYIEDYLPHSECTKGMYCILNRSITKDAGKSFTKN